MPRATPADVRSLVGPGERVLAWARARGGAVVVASTLAVYLPDPDDEGAHARLPYEQVASATWEEPFLEVVSVGPQRRRFVLELEPAGIVPVIVRDRVTASIVVSERVTLLGAAGARITARRSPAGDREVVWNVVFDAGLDATDPALRAAADDAIERLRVATGL